MSRENPIVQFDPTKRIVELERATGERENRQAYDFLQDVVDPEQKRNLQNALEKAKRTYPFLGATNSIHDLEAQLRAYRSVFEKYMPPEQQNPLVIMQHEEPTAEWIKRYKNYLVYDPQTTLTHRVIKTAQQPMQGSPFFRLVINTLHIDSDGIGEVSSTLKDIQVPSMQQ